METETISYEEKEQQLVNDCVKELREFCSLSYPVARFSPAEERGAGRLWLILTAVVRLSFAGNSNLQISSLAEELARKSDDASRQQEEITHLLSQIVDLQKKAKLVQTHLSVEHPYLSYHCAM